MSGADNISVTSLLLASSLVLITLFFSYWQKLKLEKEIIVGAIRAVIQLLIVGFVLNYIFGYKNPIFTALLLLFMIVNASYNASKRGKGIGNAFKISFIAITLGASITLSVLIFSGILAFVPNQMIPVGGMIISNAMVAIGLCYKQLLDSFKDKQEEVETKLALGADILPASIEIIRDVIRTGMVPTIDSAKTLGIVSLPGMMTGLILAGTSPIQAVKYQMMVTFMLLATTSIASFIASYLAYKGFFNDKKQLVVKQS
ncbi:ABC transporter permease [Streptococcus pseudoporcinus]|uniref:TIGR00245 family protein n=2 Tax=Streptococcus pseudoporcinus TaxID=361101 RepID=G5KAY3_9STRE|nr:iron export ABC transporter permease subunit FetB [Streptococcus pseudoporcinus]EFR43816.1 TIGR00245 family protein [Streptococcus pseudoporcinus SPIN 20026]EHI65005.1 TIGR00245 family protein [Streptococcus pseudoporcinus LQ 940-04]VEF93210.1 membrane protein [Streptococcus pseudoporcinus]VTS29661.1 membrane protein [Streptococcus pseudoporcinus]